MEEGATRLGTEAMGDAVVRAILALKGESPHGTHHPPRCARPGPCRPPPFLPVPRGRRSWPNRTIRLIVAFAAGGAADTAARTVGQEPSNYGQSVVIENRTGGNAVIAANATLQSPKDGYTFLVDAANQLTNPPLMKDLGFDYRTAFIPVGRSSAEVPAGGSR